MYRLERTSTSAPWIRVEEELSNTGLVNVDQVRLEQTLGSLEALATDADDTAIGKGVRFDENSGILGEPLVKLKVVGDIAELLLDLADGLEIGGSVQRIAAAQEEGDQVAGDIATGDVQTADVVVQHGRLVHGDNVRHTITGIHNHTAAQTYSTPVSIVTESVPPSHYIPWAYSASTAWIAT